MLYYSEKDKKFYKTEEELNKAEKIFEEQEEAAKIKREERKSRAKEIEDSYRHTQDLIKAFVKDYGNYHLSITDEVVPFFDLFDLIFR